MCTRKYLLSFMKIVAVHFVLTLFTFTITWLVLPNLDEASIIYDLLLVLDFLGVLILYFLLGYRILSKLETKQFLILMGIFTLILLLVFVICGVVIGGEVAVITYAFMNFPSYMFIMLSEVTETFLVMLVSVFIPGFLCSVGYFIKRVRNLRK